MQPFRATNLNGRRAFTLVELLVGMAILSVMVMLLVSLLSQVGNAWTRTEGQSSRLRSGRAIADYIRNDLRGALLPVAPELDDTKPNLNFVLNPSMVPDDYQQPSAMFWQVPLATDMSQGDVAEVGYFIRWDRNEFPGNPRAKLCRFFVNPTDTNNFQIYKSRQWLNESIIDAVAPAHNRPDSSTGEKAGYRGLLAENVVGFWARAARKGSDGKNLDKTWDSRKSETWGLPSYVEISFATLDDDSARRIGDAEQQAIESAVASADDAHDFLRQQQNLPTPPPYLAGLRAFSTIVYLENAR